MTYPTIEEINQPRGRAVLLAFDSLRIKLEQLETKLLGRGWPASDGRIQAGNRIRNVVQSLTSLLMFEREILPRNDFWATYFNGEPANFDVTYTETDVILRFSAMHGLFSAVESDMRVLVRALDPSACSNGRAEFDGIAKWLLKRTNTQAYSDFVEVLRLTRNTIHNNGIHRHPRGSSYSVTFDGHTLNFVDDQPIHGGWDFIVWTFHHSIEMIETVVTTPEVSALESV